MNNNIEIKQKMGLHNRFDVFRKDIRTGKEEQIAFAENIILDALWTAMFTDTTTIWAAYIHLGTGTGTLSAARTSLFTYLTNKAVSTPTIVHDETNRYISCRRSIQLSELEQNGQTISEIGLASGTGSTTLRTHAMLRDMNGNPVSILKADTDIITFYSTVYAVWDAALEDGGAVVPFYDYKNGLLATDLLGLIELIFGTDSYNGSVAFSDVDLRVQNSSSPGIGNVTYAQYPRLQKDPTKTRSLANKSFTFATRIAAGEANYAQGLFGISVDGVCIIDLISSTAWAGSTIIGEPLGTGDGTTQDFKTTFGLVKAGALVKVDGVVDATATVDVGKPTTNDLAYFMRPIKKSSRIVSDWMGIGQKGITTAQSSVFFVCENRFYQTYGIDDITLGYCNAYVSNDLVNWTLAITGTSDQNYSVPVEYRNYRYWKIQAAGTQNYGRNRYYLSDDLAGALSNNVHFTSPPAVGAALTIDYDTPIVAKDVNHVFDVSVTFSLAEYIPE